MSRKQTKAIDSRAILNLLHNRIPPSYFSPTTMKTTLLRIDHCAPQNQKVEHQAERKERKIKKLSAVLWASK
jgi:hypothetical protein